MTDVTNGASPPDETTDDLEVLDEQTCWQLLDDAAVGRLAYCLRGRPRIVPVNHAVVDGTLAIASRPGNKVEHALDLPGAAVAYEADGIDDESQTGWSVVAEGVLRAVTDEVERASLDRRLDPSWLDTFRDRRWLILEVAGITGRRLTGSDA